MDSRDDGVVKIVASFATVSLHGERRNDGRLTENAPEKQTAGICLSKLHSQEPILQAKLPIHSYVRMPRNSLSLVPIVL